MEEPKPADAEKTHLTTTLPTPPQRYPLSQPTTFPHQSDKHSNFSGIDYQSFFKIRALVQELRRHVLEVLHTPDFRNCMAADEIRKKVKVLKSLYKEKTMESHKRKKDTSEDQHSAHKSRPSKEKQNRKQMGLHQPSRFMEKGVESNPSITSLSSDQKRIRIDAGTQGSYIVGGSALGVNFITFRGTEPVYYGLTKESFRKNRKK